ncbi:uncharacterized protein LOC113324070 [Papaver somniferum]|uniref:uncharacterized protein LOC113324070 n=1 Tax=Papaver somniferum TaxID=3469 RepID=UPI000E6FA084|nr:uncharacterized protein LOC113324070 [Papaver somniferum]
MGDYRRSQCSINTNVKSSNQTSINNWVYNSINVAGLKNLGFIGSKFTWNNRVNGKGYKRSRLDLELHNVKWQIDYPDSKLYHLPFLGLDHCLILIISEADCGESSHAWKFYKCWLKDSSCSQVISNSWNSQSNSCPHQNLQNKLSFTRRSLSRWKSRQHFGHIEHQIKQFKLQLSQLQSLSFSIHISQQTESTINNLHYWRSIEAGSWQQKSGDHWVKDASNNTSYLHDFANIRRVRNNITSLRDTNRRLCHIREELSDLLTFHFSEIATTTNSALDDSYFAHIQKVITSQDNGNLMTMPDKDETYEMVKTLPSWNFPAPDGFPQPFFNLNGIQ